VGVVTRSSTGRFIAATFRMHPTLCAPHSTRLIRALIAALDDRSLACRKSFAAALAEVCVKMQSTRERFLIACVFSCVCVCVCVCDCVG
jgi:hypothetical protein